MISNLPRIDKIRNSDIDFLDDVIAVGNMVRLRLAIVASLHAEHMVDNDKEFIGVMLGHFVRLYKHYDTFLLLMCKNKLETASLFIRPIVENLLNQLYLLTCTNKCELVKLFKKSFLSYEKKLYEEIEEKLENREYDKLDKRILDSIQNSFKQSNISMDDVKWSRDKEWLKNTNYFQIAKNNSLVDLYEFLYRLGCHSIHGTWHEFYTYHLEYVDDHYEPCLGYAASRPDIIAIVSLTVLKTTTKYLEVFTRNVNDLQSDIGQLHEWYIGIFKKYDCYRSSL